MTSLLTHRRSNWVACLGLIVNLTRPASSEVFLNDFEAPEQLCPLWRPLEKLAQFPGAWSPNGVKLEQSRKHVTQGMFSARILFPNAVAKGKGWPQMLCCPRVRDWSSYEALAFDAYCTLPNPTDLQLRVDAAGKTGWLRFQLKPKKETKAQFALADLGKHVDLGHIDCVVLFVDEVPQPFDLFIDNLRLVEKGEEVRETGDPGQPHKVGIARTTAPPRVDGDLTDTCWQTAEWHSGFHPLGFPQHKAEPSTSFAMLHGQDNLFIAVRLEEPEPAKLRTKASERDGWVWTDDCVELFLDTEARGQRYYHLAVNSKGVLYDEQRNEGGASGYPEWDSSATVSAQVGDSAWLVEMSVPLADLSFSADSPSTWRINVTRERYVAGQELFSLAPLAGSFHRPQDFAFAEVTDPDLTAFLWEVRPLAEAKVSPKRGEMLYQTELALENLGQTRKTVDLQAALRCAEKESSVYYPQLELGAKTRRAQVLALAAPGLGEGVLTVSLKEPPSRRLVCRRQFRVTLSYAPLVVEVFRPHYRNSIFATQKVGALQLQVATTVATEERRDYCFQFALLSGGTVLKAQEAKVASERITMTVPLPKLRFGDYQMRGRLEHTNGKVLAEWRDTLRVLAPHPGEVRFDENWAPLINNKPFLPFGAWGYYRTPQDVQEAIKWGFNVVVDNSLPWLSDPQHQEQIKQQLDWYAAAGLRMVTPPFPLDVVWFGKGDWTKPLTAKEEGRVRSWVSLWKSHPAIFAWLLSEEPEEIPALPARLERAYQIVKEEDPYHPCIVVPDSLRGIEKYIGGCDVVMPDPYPNFIRGGGTARGMNYTSRFMNTAVSEARNRKAVWITPEAQNLSDERKGEGNFREPTFVELRNQMYQAVTAGAKGFLWYSGGYFPAYPEVGLGGQYLAKEAKALQDAILAPPSPHGFTVEPQGEHWHLSRRDVKGHTCLFAVSTSGEAKKASFSAPELKARTLFVVGEGRAVPVTAGRFTDDFEPSATHIYTTNPVPSEAEGRQPATVLNIAEVLRGIEAAKEALIKPGNLAHVSRGVTVKVSSTGDYCQGPQAINNGETAMRWWDATRDELPDWVELGFPKPEKVSRVLMDSDIVHFRVEVDKDGQWVPVAEVKFGEYAPEGYREVRTIRFAPVETRKFRITSLAVRSQHGKGHTVVWEVEAYGD